MAVEMQSSPFIVHEKFGKLKFTEYVSLDDSSLPCTPLTPDTPLLPPPEPFEMKVITKEYETKVLEFLRRFFFRDEPLNVNIKLLEGDGTCQDLEEYSLKAIKDNVSVMAITTSGKIIGVTLNGIVRKIDILNDDGISDLKFAKIIRLLEYIDKKADLFNRYDDVDKVLTVEILSVDNSWRGQGIAKKLMNKTRDLAREQGLKLMRADCTSHFSAKAFARLGFDCIYTLKYEDYKENGVQVFNPEQPHKEVKVYVQKIEG